MKKLRKNKYLIFLVDEIIKKGLMRPLSDRQFIAVEYFVTTRKFLKRGTPVKFSDKIQWIKLHGKLDRFSKYADKYQVRDFVAKTVGEEYLVPLLFVGKSFAEIDFEKLPKKFVVKATHGSAYVYICHDKDKLNKKELKSLVTKWLNENFYIKTRELQYKNCIPRIIIEPYLENSKNSLTDYKIFCYNGEPKVVEVVWGRFSNDKVDVYMDLDWNLTDIAYVGLPITTRKIPRPSNLDEMLDVARKLSKKFPFVRVDMYSIKDKVYFGEMTFTPASGLERFDPPEADFFLGESLHIEKYLKKIS